ncbi:hypothetical protein Tco_1403598 [Tanacetum coccineum]
MHTRASNSELVEPLPEPERTLNLRLRRRNRRVPFEQKNNPPQHPRIVYPPILDINYFCHFLGILQNYDPIDNEPMWAADRVVALTLGSTITIPETANEFAIKDTNNEDVRLMMFPLSLTGEAKTWLDELNESKRGMNFEPLSLADSFPQALGKSKKHSHKPKAEDSIQEKLYLLHMDLYGPMRIQNLGKLKPKADIRIFVGYALAKKAFRIYNKRTRMIIENIHVDFDDVISYGLYGMETCDPVDTPIVEKSKLNEDSQGKAIDPTRYCEMISTLMYLTSRFLHCSKAFANADHAGCQDTRKSTSQSMQLLGERLVYWSSKKHKITTISSTKPEYIALAIALCCNNIQHSQSKHIDIRHHFIKEQVENEVVELYFVRKEYQLADIFTKPFTRERLEFLIKKLGMQSMSPEILKKMAGEEEE